MRVPRDVPSPEDGLVATLTGVGFMRLLLLLLWMGLTFLALPAEAQTGGPRGLALTLEEAVRLALTKSRTAISARLGRDEQKLALEAAEERYDPNASAMLGTNATSLGDRTADLSIGPSLRVPTGGTFSLSWRKPLAGEGDRDANITLSFSQPLLKGFGPELDTQPVRRARLQERINLRAFRDAAAGIVQGAVSAYRGVLRARQRVDIAREALERARRQLAINRALVEAGRMAPQDLVQIRGRGRRQGVCAGRRRERTGDGQFAPRQHARPRRGRARRTAERNRP